MAPFVVFGFRFEGFVHFVGEVGEVEGDFLLELAACGGGGLFGGRDS